MYRIRMLQNEYDMTDPEKKSDFQKKAAYLIVKEFSTQLERENYTDAVAAKFNIPKDALAKYILELGISGVGQDKDDDYEDRPRARKTEKPKDDGMKFSQRLLITWLVEDENIYPKIQNFVGPEDFEDGVYKKVAEVVFENCQAKQPVDTAKVVDMFMEEEERKTVAALFNTTVGELTDNADLSKALKETLLRIKKNSLILLKANNADIESFRNANNVIKTLERTNISL